MKSDVLTLINGSAATRSTASSRSRSAHARHHGLRPESIDELAAAVVDALNDKHLEVSKVRPFFWLLVETYADRFRSYPFDTFKALYGYLEMKDFPADEMEAVIHKLQQAYEQKHGRPPPQGKPSPRVDDNLDAELRALKDSLCYASLVSEDIE